MPSSGLLSLHPFQYLCIMKISDGEREAFRLAAEAARPIKAQLEAEAEQLRLRIERLQTIIQLDEEASPRRPRALSANGGDPQPGRQHRTGRRLVEEQVDGLLVEDKGLTETEVRKLVVAALGFDVPRGTIYSTLRRGRTKHKYTQEDGLWKKAIDVPW